MTTDQTAVSPEINTAYSVCHYLNAVTILDLDRLLMMLEFDNKSLPEGNDTAEIYISTVKRIKGELEKLTKGVFEERRERTEKHKKPRR